MIFYIYEFIHSWINWIDVCYHKLRWMKINIINLFQDDRHPKFKWKWMNGEAKRVRKRGSMKQIMTKRNIICTFLQYWNFLFKKPLIGFDDLFECVFSFFFFVFFSYSFFLHFCFVRFLHQIDQISLKED